MVEKMKELETGHDWGKVKVLWKGYERWMELGYPLS
jgi:hypothetical protein